MTRKLFFWLFLLTVGSCFVQTSVRTVTIRVIVDKDGAKTTPIEKIKDAIRFSSKELEKNFQIKLSVVSIETRNFWPGEKELDVNVAHGDVVNAVSRDRGSADVFLVYSEKPMFWLVDREIDGVIVAVREQPRGCSFILGNSALITVTNVVSLATLHEIYHLFGAKDIYSGQEKSIMLDLDFDHANLDKKNFAAVLKNRVRTF